MSEAPIYIFSSLTLTLTLTLSVDETERPLTTVELCLRTCADFFPAATRCVYWFSHFLKSRFSVVLYLQILHD